MTPALERRAPKGGSHGTQATALHPGHQPHTAWTPDAPSAANSPSQHKCPQGPPGLVARVPFPTAPHEGADLALQAGRCCAWGWTPSFLTPERSTVPRAKLSEGWRWGGPSGQLSLCPPRHTLSSLADSCVSFFQAQTWAAPPQGTLIFLGLRHC